MLGVLRRIGQRPVDGERERERERENVEKNVEKNVLIFGMIFEKLCHNEKTFLRILSVHIILVLDATFVTFLSFSL